jgi:hypothetical protein
MTEKRGPGIFDRLPHKHLSESEKQYIALIIEKSKINRERATMILEKGLLLFFAFLVFAVIAMQNEMINKGLFNLLVIASVCVLMLSVTPYIKISKTEEKKIDDILRELTG